MQAEPDMGSFSHIWTCAKFYGAFGWLCAKEAAENTLSQANAVAAIGGSGLLLGALWFWGLKMEAPTDVLGTLELTIVFAVGSTILAYMVIFFVRWLGAPARLYAKLKSTIPVIPESDIDVKLGDKIAYEAGLTDTEGKELQGGAFFAVRVSNRGNRFLQNCQICFGPKDQFNYPVCRPFDLRRGEYKELPVLRIRESKERVYAILYFLNANKEWKIVSGGSGWLPEPGSYEIRVLSTDSHPATLDVELSHSDKWMLSECN